MLYEKNETILHEKNYVELLKKLSSPLSRFKLTSIFFPKENLTITCTIKLCYMSGSIPQTLLSAGVAQSSVLLNIIKRCRTSPQGHHVNSKANFAVTLIGRFGRKTPLAFQLFLRYQRGWEWLCFDSEGWPIQH